ncbi:hypothetical protein JOD52_001269 [Brachybacterium muris]|uniref:hypothetical protein n=1 Tax=Brachybacterium muris TaxID=219301 RepID=UPI0019595E90|nr:hypothetical protein [Brachybacterium muris]MBM7500429.1 hypothetical protein [Brachybacterium muris]
MPAGASGPHRGGYWPPSARSAVPKSKIRWLPRLRILSETGVPHQHPAQRAAMRRGEQLRRGGGGAAALNIRLAGVR